MKYTVYKITNNDGKKSFMLKPTDQRILGGILKQGRLKW